MGKLERMRERLIQEGVNVLEISEENRASKSLTLTKTGFRIKVPLEVLEIEPGFGIAVRFWKNV